METIEKKITDWKALTHEMGKTFAENAERSDQDEEFVYDNYKKLKEHKYFSILVPKEFGGAGLSHAEVCNMIRIIGRYCGSTALAFSMHQHLIAANVWKYKHSGTGASLLKKVADKQIVLVSTGARDWLGSNGEMKKVDGGYLVNAKKYFASQSADGDIAITSAPYQNKNGEWKVLHFPVPFDADGVSILDDWHVLGMRGTGSQTLQFEDVFVPESAIVLERPRDEFHPVWHVVLTVALPLIMAAYVGIAERAKEIAISMGRKYQKKHDHVPFIIGQMSNQLISAQVQWQAMYRRTNNFDFKVNEQLTREMLLLKTNVSNACISTVDLAMESVGGQSYYKSNTLERLFRDVQAGEFHPMTKWAEWSFIGDALLNRN